MKTLYLIRHAKSDWNASYGDDHERPLNKRGVRAAQLMGRFLRDVDQIPDAVVSSSAVRARTTVELMAAAGGWTCPLRVTRRFYDTGPESVLQEVRTESDGYPSLLLAGHQPTWSSLIEELTDFEVDRWSELSEGRGVLVFFVVPKLLQSTGWAPE